MGTSQVQIHSYYSEACPSQHQCEVHAQRRGEVDADEVHVVLRGLPLAQHLVRPQNGGVDEKRLPAGQRPGRLL